MHADVRLTTNRAGIRILNGWDHHPARQLTDNLLTVLDQQLIGILKSR
jgi:hypothetical protein